MTEYKNVGTPGHVDYVEKIRGRNVQIIIIDDAGIRHAEPSDLAAISPAVHEAFSSGLMPRRFPQLQNRETWRGKGKRRMPRGSQ